MARIGLVRCTALTTVSLVSGDGLGSPQGCETEDCCPTVGALDRHLHF